MLIDGKDHSEYFRVYNARHPVMVLRCDSVQTKESIRAAAMAAGETMQHFVLDRLAVRLAEEALEDSNAIVD